MTFTTGNSFFVKKKILPSVTVTTVICILFFFTSFQSAEGATLNFPNPVCPTAITPATAITPGDTQAGMPFQFKYDDSSNPIYTTNNAFDTITINVKSTTDPTGVPLVLNETGPNDGIFMNTNFVFMEGSDNRLPLNRDVTITLADSGGTDPLNVIVRSDSDLPGITVPFHLSGTNATTKFFSGKVTFTDGPSGGTSIHAQPGDVVTAVDPLSAYTSSGLIVPNDKSTIRALVVNFNDIVTISYNGLTCDATVADELGIPGGGGGGLVVRPGFVLDAIAAIGGSPFIVSPPSFGGGSYHYSDGLAITQGTAKTIFDTSKYNQEIPTQVLVSGKKVDMTFKTFESYNPAAVIHMGLYLIPRGQDMITPNSVASIVWEKNSPVQVNEPNHILSSATASSNSDGKFQYTKFSFVPTKSYDKMSFLVRAWNDHMYSTDARIHDAVDESPAQETLPAGVIRFDDWSKLYEQFTNDGFDKAKLLSHIQGDNSLGNSGIHAYWLYNTNTHEVTMVIYSKTDGKIIEEMTGLEKINYSHLGYCDMPIFKCTIKPIYIDTPEGKAAIEKYNSMYTEQMKMLDLPRHIIG